MTRFFFSVLLVISFALAACSGSNSNQSTGPHIDSLAVLSIESLRSRKYGSTITLVEPRSNEASHSYIAAYNSDGLRVYARVDIPLIAPPAEGYPVVIFVHGWAGVDAAPELNFYYDKEGNYGEIIDAFVEAGFAVFTPGFRGHGTVKGVPAEGIDFMHAWDNGSYLSPVFYAIDVLNLIDGLESYADAKLDLDRINTVSHSQGGDAALIALAVAGEGSNVKNEIQAASIWSGAFPARFTQLKTYWPMQRSPEAFMSGDGTWNGTAVSASGVVNERFVFGYPSDWIETVNQDEWTWQQETWSEASVVNTIREKLDQMYTAVNTFVDDIDNADYQLAVGDSGAFAILHDARIQDAMNSIGGFHAEQFLTEPLALQHSDRDFYSLPEWNADLCARVNAAGGDCYDFEYFENTHSLRVSDNRWFSSAEASPGFSYAIQRDIALFRGSDPREIPFP